MIYHMLLSFYIYTHIYILIYVHVYIEGGGGEREREHTCSPVWPLKLPYKFRISSGFNYSFMSLQGENQQISMFQVIAVLKKKKPNWNGSHK